MEQRFLSILLGTAMACPFFLPVTAFAQRASQCEDGQVCTDGLPMRVAPVVPPSSSMTQLKDLERNPGGSPALKQRSIKALKAHASLEGTPGWSPASGPDNASVKVYVFSDFQCPVCRRVVEPMKFVAREYPADVQVIFIQNALKMHSNAENAAAASMAAGRQNKFWEYHDLLFKDQRKLSEFDLLEHARSLKLNMKRFKRDMASKATRAQIDYERNLSKELGVRGTPGFFINGRRMVGWGSTHGFKSMVERALREAKGVKVPAGVPRVVAATRAKGDDGKKFAELVWGVK